MSDFSTISIVKERYFKWMMKLMAPTSRNYKKLFSYLNSVAFVWQIPMDANREEDGRELRYRFGYENDYPDPMIACEIDISTPSVLEVMIALAVRLEEAIMERDKFEPQRWFWGMIESLGLIGQSDDVFQESVAELAVYKLIERRYSPDGKGGLFTVPGRMDISEKEIWYQAQAYLIYIEGGQ